VMLGSDWLDDSRVPQVHKMPYDLLKKMQEAIGSLSGGPNYPTFSRHSRAVGCARSSAHTGRSWVGMTTEQADAAQTLSDGIQELIVLFSNIVAQRELSFLTKMASGEASVEDYEKRIASQR